MFCNNYAGSKKSGVVETNFVLFFGGVIAVSSIGTFTISIDTEFAWGRCDIPYSADEMKALDREREIITRLGQLFEQYDMRATWAIVGHLFLDKPAPRDCQGRVHGHIPRPMTQNEERDWFFQLPDGLDPQWYAPEVVDQIQAMKPTQEIGSHTFSHLIYDEGFATQTAVEHDLVLARSVHEAKGVPFESFVFPRNQVGYLPQLAEAGLKVYRGRTEQWQDRLPGGVIGRLANLIGFMMALPPKTVTPEQEEGSGLVNVPDSLLLLGRNGLRRLVPRGNLVRMAKRGLDRAAEKKQLFHLWFHPSNFVHRTEEQFQTLERILQHASFLREQGQLDVLTMGDHVKQFPNRI